MVYPRVSIVMPTLNQGRFIREAIDSVLCQSYPEVELIVIDGASNDNTLSILQSYGNRIVWRSERDSGQSAAINAGMRLSSGLILGWLNSDDTLLPGAISAVVEEFRAHPTAGVIFGDTLFTDPTGVPLFRSKAKPFDYAELAVGCRNPIPQPSAFIARAAWENLNETLHYFLDWDLWLRVGKKHPIVHVPELWSTYRIHSESKTGAANYPVEELSRIYRKNFGGGKLPPELYRRMGEYFSANGQWARALVSRGRAWLNAK